MMPTRTVRRSSKTARTSTEKPTALVTGWAGGLGRPLVEGLRAAGYSVVGVDRYAASREPGFVPVECDLSDPAAIEGHMDELIARGPYDIAIFAAGISATGPFEDLPVEVLARIVTVNTQAPIMMTAGLLRGRALRRRICYVSSLSRFVGYPGAAAYAASKDALAAYGRSIRPRVAREGLSVTIAYPGPIDTPMAERHAPPGGGKGARMKPADAAAAILTATMAGRAMVVPGRSSKLFALAGHWFPGRTNAAMRRIIYDKLGDNRFD